MPSSTVPSTPIRSPAATSTVIPGATAASWNRTLPAVGFEHRHRARAEREQALRGGARVSAGAPVEIAADQQEEQQHDSRIEVDVRTAARGLEQAHAARQQNADRDRHVHVGAPVAQRASAESKNGRPAYRIAGSAISAENQCSRSRVAGPMSWKWPAQTETDSSMMLPAANPATAMARSRALGRGLGAHELRRVVGDHAIAERAHRPNQAVGDRGAAQPVDHQAPGGQVDARMLDRGIGQERLLDPAHAAAAVHALDHQVQHRRPSPALCT